MTGNVFIHILFFSEAKKLQEEKKGSFKKLISETYSALKINSATLNVGFVCEELAQTVL